MNYYNDSVFLYRHLDIDNLKEIQNEQTAFVMPYTINKPTGLWTLNNDEFFNMCPLTVNFLKTSNIFDKYNKCAVIIVHSSPYQLVPHTDGHFDGPVGFPSNGSLSMNFEIQNCIDAPVKMYKYVSGNKTGLMLPAVEEGSYDFYDECEMLELGQYNLHRPVIMNNTVPHALVNQSGSTRISLSLRFKPDPWELIDDRFK